ncbi:MAG TPA: S8 family serine peptidase [Thermoleophilaceae bacterium]|nr:S8 family serine peptidase [Thermoleophilaceae bacterium]
MRRAVLAIFLCAVPLLAAPAQASTGLLEREALREALRQRPHASNGGVVALPLPEPASASAASARGELARIASTSGPERLLIGARTHADLASLAATVRSLGAEPELFTTIGAMSATVPSGAAAVASLRGDPRVAYIERDRTLRVAADPFDILDPTSGPPPIKFTWAYDTVRAGEALATVGGGSSRIVSVIDTGLDVNHPEFAGQVARVFDTASGGADVTDLVGHGTFVSGLISALDGNGRGGKGVAGTTKLIAVRASTDGGFTVGDLISGIDFSIRRGADVINMSLAGDASSFTQTQARALEAAFFNDVLPIAAAGNNAENGNPVEFPAAAIGGRQGGRGIGLSVAATKPDGAVASFSDHNEFVSLAAPGASGGSCEFGVFSTLPANGGTEWDNPQSCSRIFTDGSARYAYGEGTSFAAPIVAGLAALAWQAERRLASEQVAEVMVRSGNGGGWNEFTGAGLVDGKKAVDIAATYDVIGPKARGKARRRGNRVKATVARAKDRTDAGDELAGAVSYGLLVSRDGGRSYGVIASRKRKPFSKNVRLRGRKSNVLVGTACDGNGNCGVKILGRFKQR